MCGEALPVHQELVAPASPPKIAWSSSTRHRAPGGPCFSKKSAAARPVRPAAHDHEVEGLSVSTVSRGSVSKRRSRSACAASITSQVLPLACL